MATVLVMTSQETKPLVPVVAQEQHYVIAAEGSGEVLTHVIQQQSDVVIIPEHAEPVEGVELLAALRWMTAASIIVVGSGGENRLAQALLQGADCYFPTPVVPRQLQVRLRTLLRPRRSQQVPSLPESEQDNERQKLFQGLSPREVQLLDELLGRRGAFVTREELLARVWGNRGRSASLRLYISRLRAKLALQGGLLDIQNCKGVGYRLVAGRNGRHRADSKDCYGRRSTLVRRSLQVPQGDDPCGLLG